jgi:kynurenine formamidase
MRRIIGWLGFAALLATGCQATGEGAVDPASVFDGTTGRWVDLTYAYNEESIFWPTSEGFVHEQVAYGVTEGGWFYSNNNLSLSEHGGTHFDAPIHFAAERDHAEEVPLDRLIGAAVVVDVSDRVHPDYLVTAVDLQRWETVHGRIPDGAILLIRTGWGQYWPDPVRYLGTDQKGAEAVPLLHFPGIGPDAARWLVENRSIAAIGIDTPSIDYGQSSTFETHQILYTRNIPGLENIAYLDELPAVGSYVVALPMKIEGGSGGPLRIVAFIPNQ